MSTYRIASPKTRELHSSPRNKLLYKNERKGEGQPRLLQHWLGGGEEGIKKILFYFSFHIILVDRVGERGLGGNHWETSKESSH